MLFPVVLLLGLNGLFVGILNAYDHFTIPALSPLVWNVVILVCLVGSQHVLSGDDQLYGYAIGVLVGTAVQFAMALPMLHRLGFHLEVSFAFRDERVRQVLLLMLPVTIGLGLINFNVLINSTLGSLVSDQAPRAIDAAFRIYMLPQGMFSVAIATVLFPALSRFAARRDYDGLRALTANGMRQIFLLLVPAAAATLALSEPITRLIYQHGRFGTSSTDLVSSALFWFSFSLPFSGVNLLLTRTFFSLQKPWITTGIAGLNLSVNVAVSVALYKPFGIAGIVIGTGVSSAVMTLAQMYFLRRELHGRLDVRRTLIVVIQITLAAALLAGAAYGTLVPARPGAGRRAFSASCSRWASPCRWARRLRDRGPPAADTGGAPDRALRLGTAGIARRTVGNSRQTAFRYSSPRPGRRYISRMRLTSALWAWRWRALPTPPRLPRRWSTTSLASNGCCRRCTWPAAGACAAPRCTATGRPATGCRGPPGIMGRTYRDGDRGRRPRRQRQRGLPGGQPGRRGRGVLPAAAPAG